MDKQVVLIPIPLTQFWAQLEDKLDKRLVSIERDKSEEKEELLDVHQVAKLLHTTPQNIHAKKRAGQIPFVRFGGRILFKRSEVIASLKSVKINRGL